MPFMERFRDDGVRNGVYTEHRLEWLPPAPPDPEDCPYISISVHDDPDEAILVEFVDEVEGTATNTTLLSILQWVKRNRPELTSPP